MFTKDKTVGRGAHIRPFEVKKKVIDWDAVGGAINIRTMAPSFTWKGKVTAGYGNYNNRSANGYVTGPISDKLAFSLAAASGTVPNSFNTSRRE